MHVGQENAPITTVRSVSGLDGTSPRGRPFASGDSRRRVCERWIARVMCYY